MVDRLRAHDGTWLGADGVAVLLQQHTRSTSYSGSSVLVEGPALLLGWLDTPAFKPSGRALGIALVLKLENVLCEFTGC